MDSEKINSLLSKGYIPLDIAVHGRSIVNTEYNKLWSQTISLLSTYCQGLLYNNLSRANVKFSITMGNTACINMKTKEIYLNPKFIREHASTPINLAGLILHELLHPVIQPVDLGVYDIFTNIATDALINSTIYRLNPALCSLMKDTYNIDQYPGILLRPQMRSVWAGAILSPDKPEFETVYGYNTEDVFDDEEQPLSLDVVEEKEKPKTINISPVPHFSHLDIYKNLYPQTQIEFEYSLRPSYQTILNRFYPNLDEIRQAIASQKIYIIVESPGGVNSGSKGEPIDIPEGATVIRIRGTLSDEKDKTSIDPKELENLPEEVKKEVEKIVDELNEKHGEEGESPFNKTKEQKQSKGASKSGKLEKHISEVARKEDVFKTKLARDPNAQKRAAKILLDGIKSKFKEKALNPKKGDGIYNTVNAAENFDLDAEVNSAFDAASQSYVRGKILNTFNPMRKANKSLLPYNVSRTGLSLISAGYLPFFWKKSTKAQDPALRSTDVYIDFSGSMWSYIPWVLRLVIEMETSCSSRIFGFSTVISEITIDKIKKGEYSSTGGTSFNEVIEHFVEENTSQKCLIITDGYDNVGTEYFEMLQSSKKQMYMLVVGENINKESMEKSHSTWCKEIFYKEFTRKKN